MEFKYRIINTYLSTFLFVHIILIKYPDPIQTDTFMQTNACTVHSTSNLRLGTALISRALGLIPNYKCIA
jgi:hypothetical protein